MTALPAPAAPRLEVVEGAVGAALAGERAAQGLSLEQVAAATRIRLGHLAAIEREDAAALPGAVYARGYVRTYAGFLGLDPEPLLRRLEPPASAPGAPRATLSLARLAPRLPEGLVISGPLLTALALGLGIALFAGYALYELRSARLDSAPAAPAAPAAAPPIASPAPLPSAAPAAAAPSAPAPRQIAVAIRASELAWVQVTVDGRPAYGASGRMLQAGAEDVFVGGQVKVSTGKPTLLVSLSGGDFAPLGTLSREYSAQT